MLALAEQVLEDLVRLELGGVGLVDAPPEELGALEASHEARLRKATGSRVFRHQQQFPPDRGSDK